jgi:hypothetical protein
LEIAARREIRRCGEGGAEVGVEESEACAELPIVDEAFIGYSER